MLVPDMPYSKTLLTEESFRAQIFSFFKSKSKSVFYFLKLSEETRTFMVTLQIKLDYVHSSTFSNIPFCRTAHFILSKVPAISTEKTYILVRCCYRNFFKHRSARRSFQNAFSNEFSFLVFFLSAHLCFLKGFLQNFRNYLICLSISSQNYLLAKSSQSLKTNSKGFTMYFHI